MPAILFFRSAEAIRISFRPLDAADQGGYIDHVLPSPLVHHLDVLSGRIPELFFMSRVVHIPFPFSN